MAKMTQGNLLSAALTHPANGQPLLLSNFNLIDGTGAPAQPGSALLIEGERITQVWPGATPDLANVAVLPLRLDLAGRSLMPGLIDMHVHLRGDDWALPFYLGHGVTSVRDCGNSLKVLHWLDDQVQSDRRPGPRLFFSGPFFDSPPMSWPHFMCNLVGSPEQLEKALEGLGEHPVDFIKIYTNLGARELGQLVEQAKAWGYYLTMHPGGGDLVASLNTGLGGLEHIFGLSRHVAPEYFSQISNRDNNGAFFRQVAQVWLDLERGLIPAAHTELLRVLDLMLEKETLLTPTLALNWSCAYLDSPEVSGHPLITKTSVSMRQSWARRPLVAGWQAADFELAQQSIPIMAQYAAYYKRQGGQILVGSDTPNAYLLPGVGLHHELELLAAAGIPPLEVIKLATHDAAQVLERSHRANRPQRFGKIAPGYLADLLILEKDPTTDIRHCREITRVLKGGKIYDPAALLPQTQPTEETANV